MGWAGDDVNINVRGVFDRIARRFVRKQMFALILFHTIAQQAVGHPCIYGFSYILFKRGKHAL